MIFSHLLSGAYTSQSPFLSDAIYAALLAGLVFLAVGIYLWLKRRGKFAGIRLDYDPLFLVVYFLVMLIVARSAIRFDFFLAPIELTFGSVAIVWLLQQQVGKNQINRVVSSMGVILLTWQLFALRDEVPVWFLKFYIAFAITLTLGIITIHFREMAKERLSTKTFARKSLIVWTVALVLVILTGPVQLMLLSGYAKASYDSATAVEPFVNSKLRQGLSWLRTASPQDSVIAASWEWGSAINLIADRRTIVDEEQFEPWVYKMYRHVFVGHTEREALTTLKAHDATHLLITAHDINHIQQISYVGSDQASDREITLPLFGVVVEQVKTDTGLVVYRYLPHESVSVEWVAPPEIGADVKVLWQIVSIYLQINSSDDHPVLTSVTLELRHQDFMIRQPPERIFFQGKQRTNTNQEDTVPCTLLIRATKDDPFDWSILYLSQAARTSLAIRLYLLDEASDYFTPVYPQPTATSGEYFARIWKIHYPPDLVETANGIGRKSK